MLRHSDPIKHVVYLMMENQSFDRKLGDVKSVKPDIDGVDPAHPHFNLDDKQNKIYQRPTTALQMRLDPMHEVPAVNEQLADQNGGFVRNFISHYPASTATDRQGVMAYYPNGFLPATHALATEYTVCDRWFSSVPGPTWTNRCFALSGTSNGRVKMPAKVGNPDNLPKFFYQTQDNLFDRLDEQDISWKVYCGDFPISLVLTQNREPEKLANYRNMRNFFDDAKGPAEEFPQFVFIEPKYLTKHQNDDHPPHNTMKAERLIADVYNALRSNEELWKSTLFVLTYDEHGGFYDHVIPPQTVAPDDHREDGFAFDQLGLRVPTILISPWAKKPLDHTVYDHTSVLKYLIEKWNLRDLGERTRQANSIADALDIDGEPRHDCLRSVFIPDGAYKNIDPRLEKDALNDNHETIHAFADYLNQTDKQHPIPALASPSKSALFKEKMGKNLEQHGFLRSGKLLRKEMHQYHKSRVKQTLTIAGNKLMMFQPEVKSAEVEKPNHQKNLK